jgi:hypothetical protein
MDSLLPGQSLSPGSSLLSPNGRYRLTYDVDGNLALYGKGHLLWHTLWQAGTTGKAAGICILQEDGNLVIYSPGDVYVWDTETHNNPGSRLYVQDDGNVVIYGPDNATAIWHTRTATFAAPAAIWKAVMPGEAIYPGEHLRSPNWRYRLSYEITGDLALYGPTGILWQSGTRGRRAGISIMQEDGNFVIYSPGPAYVWNTETHDNPGARLYVQDDGNVVIYGPDNTTAIWQTDTPNIKFHHEFHDLNGRIDLTLHPDGRYTFKGHIHNGRVESLDFQVSVLVTSKEGVVVAFRRSGRLGGWLSGEPDDFDWNEAGRHPMIRLVFENLLLDGQLEVHESAEGVITGAIDDVLDAALKWVAGTILVGTGSGLVILVGALLGSAVATGSFSAGARIVAGVLWMAGPYGTMYAIGAEGVARLGTKRRKMSDAEYDWAQDIFGGTLPARETIIITDSLGGRGAPFVFPAVGGEITMNLGPDHYEGPLVGESMFVHELVHVWQLTHTGSDIGWLADALVTQVCQSLFGNQYTLPDAGRSFSDLDLEEQAEAVQWWWGLKDDPSTPIDERTASPYYRYIVENIRMGKT